MANVNGTMGATPSPNAARVKQICDFFRTGSVNPTQSTPTLRAGTTGSTTIAATSVNITIPSGASVGDTMFIFVQQSASANTGSSPPGFSQLYMIGVSSGSTSVFYKALQVGDPGSTITWSGLSVAAQTIAWACYSNVDTAVPVAAFTDLQNGSLLSSGTTTSFSTAAPQVILEVFGCFFANIGGTISGVSGTGTTVIEVQPTSPNTQGGILVQQTNQTVAGTAGGTTVTVTGQTSRFNSLAIALNGQPTGGTALSCTSLVETYAPYFSSGPATANCVWKWPGTSNNVHGDCFIVFSYNPNMNTVLTFYGCESYSTSNHTWNAFLMNFNNNNFTFPNGGPSGSTTPPWAYVASPANTVGTTSSGIFAPFDTISTGSSTYMFAANNDGFFYSSTNGGTLGNSIYMGAFTSLVVNPNITDSVNFCGMTWSNGGSSTGASSREPGYNWPGATNAFGSYQGQPFYPLDQSSVGNHFGVLNGSMTPNDLFQAPPNQPLCCRWTLSRSSTFWSPNGYQVGILRGLLPTWIKFLLSSGCNWGDTTTDVVNSDTLFFAGTNTSNTDCWIDTTAA